MTNLMVGPDENPEPETGTQSNQQGVCWELAEDSELLKR